MAKRLTINEVARMGALALNKKLTKAQRSANGRKGMLARWRKHKQKNGRV